METSTIILFILIIIVVVIIGYATYTYFKKKQTEKIIANEILDSIKNNQNSDSLMLFEMNNPEIVQMLRKHYFRKTGSSELEDVKKFNEWNRSWKAIGVNLNINNIDDIKNFNKSKVEFFDSQFLKSVWIDHQDVFPEPADLKNYTPVDETDFQSLDDEKYKSTNDLVKGIMKGSQKRRYAQALEISKLFNTTYTAYKAKLETYLDFMKFDNYDEIFSAFKETAEKDRLKIKWHKSLEVDSWKALVAEHIDNKSAVSLLKPPIFENVPDEAKWSGALIEAIKLNKIYIGKKKTENDLFIEKLRADLKEKKYNNLYTRYPFLYKVDRAQLTVRNMSPSAGINDLIRKKTKFIKEVEDMNKDLKELDIIDRMGPDIEFTDELKLFDALIEEQVAKAVTLARQTPQCSQIESVLNDKTDELAYLFTSEGNRYSAALEKMIIRRKKDPTYKVSDHNFVCAIPVKDPRYKFPEEAMSPKMMVGLGSDPEKIKTDNALDNSVINANLVLAIKNDKPEHYVKTLKRKIDIDVDKLNTWEIIEASAEIGDFKNGRKLLETHEWEKIIEKMELKPKSDPIKKIEPIRPKPDFLKDLLRKKKP